MNELQNFDNLLHKYFEGLATTAEVQELEGLLLADDALVERASEQSLLHRQVFELLTEERLHELMDKFVGSTAPSQHPCAAAASITEPRANGPGWSTPVLAGDGTRLARRGSPAGYCTLAAFGFQNRPNSRRLL